jgi:hypothetical protein
VVVGVWEREDYEQAVARADKLVRVQYGESRCRRPRRTTTDEIRTWLESQRRAGVSPP